MGRCWCDIWQRRKKIFRKNLHPSATLTIINPTWNALEQKQPRWIKVILFASVCTTDSQTSETIIRLKLQFFHTLKTLEDLLTSEKALTHVTLPCHVHLSVLDTKHTSGSPERNEPVHHPFVSHIVILETRVMVYRAHCLLTTETLYTACSWS
jgi:hypothetical protein